MGLLHFHFLNLCGDMGLLLKLVVPAWPLLWPLSWKNFKGFKNLKLELEENHKMAKGAEITNNSI